MTAGSNMGGAGPCRKARIVPTTTRGAPSAWNRRCRAGALALVQGGEGTRGRHGDGVVLPGVVVDLALDKPLEHQESVLADLGKPGGWPPGESSGSALPELPARFRTW